MLTSLSLIFLVGLAMAYICRKIRLPRIIGMLVTGIVLMPYVPGKTLLRKWLGTIIGFPVLALIMAWIMFFF